MRKLWSLLTFLFLIAHTACIHPVADNNRYNQMLAVLRNLPPDPVVEGKQSIPVAGDISFGALTHSPKAQMELALSLMARNDRFATTPYNVTFTPDAWESLHLIDSGASILDSFGARRTIFGHLYLAKLLTGPTTNISHILRRQKLIKLLAEQPALTDAITAHLTNLAYIEPHLLGLADAEHPIYRRDLRIYHHDWATRKLFLRNRIWQNFSKLFGDLWFIVGPIMIAVGTYKLVKASMTMNDATLHKRIPVPRWVRVLLTSLVATYGFTQAISTLRWAYRRHQALRYIYHQLRPLKSYFKTIDQLHELATRVPAIRKMADEIDLQVIYKDPHVFKLKKILDSPAFSSPILAQAMGGDLIMALDLLEQCRPKLFKGVALVGGLDAYVRLAAWYKKGQENSRQPICTAQFISQDRPYLSVSDFWHPSAPAHKVTTNSLTLGNDQTQNMIVTGLYESGKSMLLQAIACNVLCAQTIGICPAKSYKATPFGALNVYANITDDIANNRSLFKTELYRAQQLVKSIKANKAFSFSIADGTFTGTEANAGQAAAYAVARHLGSLDNSIAIHATNFLSLTALGLQYPERFRNYHLPSELSDAMKHSYKLTPGIKDPISAEYIFSEENLPEEMLNEMKLPQTQATPTQEAYA